MPDGSTKLCTMVNITDFNASVVIWEHGKINILTNASKNLSQLRDTRVKLREIIMNCL